MTIPSMRSDEDEVYMPSKSKPCLAKKDRVIGHPFHLNSFGTTTVPLNYYFAFPGVHLPPIYHKELRSGDSLAFNERVARVADWFAKLAWSIVHRSWVLDRSDDSSSSSSRSSNTSERSLSPVGGFPEFQLFIHNKLRTMLVGPFMYLPEHLFISLWCLVTLPLGSGFSLKDLPFTTRIKPTDRLIREAVYGCSDYLDYEDCEDPVDAAIKAVNFVLEAQAECLGYPFRRDTQLDEFTRMLFNSQYKRCNIYATRGSDPWKHWVHQLCPPSMVMSPSRRSWLAYPYPAH